MLLEPPGAPILDVTEALARLSTGLVGAGVIDQRTLDRAQRITIEAGGRLDHILTQLGLVSERSLAEALAKLLAVPLVPAAGYPQTALFPDRLKPQFLRRERARPIAVTDDRVVLAMADPLDRFTRDAVAAALGRCVDLAVAVPAEFEAAF